jgi:monoamine oxidase
LPYAARCDFIVLVIFAPRNGDYVNHAAFGEGGESMSLMRSKPQVAVVGAGLAGITAALSLTDRGIDVVVLEARDRVGGRVCSVRNELGMRIDLGSQWVGPSMTRMHRLIEQEGLTKVSTYHTGRSIYAMAGRIKYGHGNRPPITPLFLLDQLQFRYRITSRFRQLDPAAPWNSAAGQRLDGISVGDFIEQSTFTDWSSAYWRTVVSESLCANPSEVSMLDYLWELRSCGTLDNMSAAENVWIKESAYMLAERLAGRLSGRIHLRTPVRSIAYGRQGAEIVTDQGRWQAERVIVAIPPILAGSIDYSPAMPHRTERLLRGIRPGRVVKCVLTYSRPFWRANGYNGLGYYESGPVKATIDSTHPDRPEGIIVAMVCGEEVLRFGRLERAARRQAVTACLARHFGGEALAPVAYADMNWCDEPWSLGGYGGHAAPGLFANGGEALHEPVGPIHWAGTETASAYRQYMEGAVQSGERAADEVIQALAVP